ncbi:hypothetical protein P7C73_g673, partial [Tremellales sp. Uapishka_1]
MVQINLFLASLLAISVATTSTMGLAINKTVTLTKFETNAERMARGLGPLPPTRILSAPMRRASASSQDPAGVFGGPSKTYLMRLRNPLDGSEQGIASMPSGDDGLINVDTDLTRALRFAFKPSQNDPFEITPVDQDGNVYGRPSSLLGTILGSGGDNGILDLTRGSAKLVFSFLELLHRANGFRTSYAKLGMTPRHPGVLDLNLPLLSGASQPGSESQPETPSAGPPCPFQSAIWTFHPRTSRLLAHYVNSDGNTVPTYFVTGGQGCQHTICLSADVDAFRTAWGADATEVTLLAYADL